METASLFKAQNPRTNLGNFLSGMETEDRPNGGTMCHHLGNFLSGMETALNVARHSGLRYLGNFLSGMETLSLWRNIGFDTTLETSLVEWKQEQQMHHRYCKGPWKLP